MKHLKLYEDIDWDEDFDFEEEEQFDDLDIKDFELRYGKLTPDSIIKLKAMNPSYKQLVDSGIWTKVKIRDRRAVIDVIKHKQANVGDIVICWDDKRRMGLKPLITEGYKYTVERVRGNSIFIKNDEDRPYWYDAYRFCWK